MLSVGFFFSTLLKKKKKTLWESTSKNKRLIEKGTYKHSSYGQLLSMAGLSTLHNRRLQDIAILMYKVKNNMCPTYISTLFEQPAIKYKLRNHDFTIPRFNTVSFGKHSLRYMGPRVWSSVPSNVKKASTLSSFKYNIRKVDLSMLLDDNNCSNCSLCTS